MSAWLADWRARRQAAQGADRATRWVLIDTETSGLDVTQDRLIAMAGVAIDIASGKPVLRLADSLELVLRCPDGIALDEVARHNILLHGVGRGEQDQGLEPAEGLRRLRHWVNGAPCLAFHAAFDATVLDLKPAGSLVQLCVRDESAGARDVAALAQVGCLAQALYSRFQSELRAAQ